MLIISVIKVSSVLVAQADLNQLMVYQVKSVLKATTASRHKELRVPSTPQRRTRSLQVKDRSKMALVSRSHVKQDSKVYTNAHSTSKTASLACLATTALVQATLHLLSLAQKDTSVLHPTEQTSTMVLRPPHRPFLH